MPYSHRLEYLRFLIVGPVTFIALACFALYFGPRNAGYFQKGLPQILWGATAGVLTATTNIAFNWIAATFIFLELPTTVFTTDRLDALRKRGNPLAQQLSQVINAWDPGHFKD